MMKIKVNINLKKIDEIWSELQYEDNHMKSEENLMRFEVNINLKKIRWNLKWT